MASESSALLCSQATARPLLRASKQQHGITILSQQTIFLPFLSWPEVGLQFGGSHIRRRPPWLTRDKIHNLKPSLM